MPDFPYLSRERIRQDLQSRGAAVRKSLGQNFLIDPNYIDRLVSHIQAATGQGESILEIGPGLGALTHRLVQFASVTAFEIDRVLAVLLRELFSNQPAFHLVEGDARKTIGEYSAPVICGNLPYYITTELILESLNVKGGRDLFFLVQSEFARRACANHAESSFAVYLRNFGTPRLLERVPAGCFFPAPSVESAFFHVGLHTAPIASPPLLERLLRMSYRGKRKKLQNSWAVGEELLPVDVLRSAAAETGVDTEKRAEEIPIEKYHAMAASLFTLLSHEGEQNT